MRSFRVRLYPLAVASVLVVASSLQADPRSGRGHSRPAIVFTLMNRAPEHGNFLTPVWIGLHDGSFDIYDRGAPADSLPSAGSMAVERLAEDGNNGPISADFEAQVPDGVQSTVLSNGPIPPLAPGQVVSHLFEVDPGVHRYFSYASMVIPSNDAFIANGSPTAHVLFDPRGRFRGESFKVAGSEVNDAGTELNDEVPANTAFFGQAAPDTGVTTADPVSVHPGFLSPGSGGILDDPMFAAADFLAPGYEVLGVRLTFIDLKRPLFLDSRLNSEQEVQDPPVESDGSGRAHLLLLGDRGVLVILVHFRRLSGPLTGAHLHLAPAGQNGPIVVDLTDDVLAEHRGGGGLIFARVRGDDVTGPLGATTDPFGSLIAELLGGGIYINLHTEMHPPGEIRGQISPR